jgi:prepilin-type N-terminal cleavage/methylation domain-containing protein
MSVRSASSPVRDEAGFTLIEVIVTVAIMGISFLIIVGGIGTAILGSDLNRRKASVQSVLRTAAEDVKGANYVACATTYPLPPTEGYTSALEVDYWDALGNTFVAGTCVPATDTGLQLVSITVTRDATAEAHNVEASVQVVKRRDAK